MRSLPPTAPTVESQNSWCRSKGLPVRGACPTEGHRFTTADYGLWFRSNHFHYQMVHDFIEATCALLSDFGNPSLLVSGANGPSDVNEPSLFEPTARFNVQAYVCGPYRWIGFDLAKDCLNHPSHRNPLLSSSNCGPTMPTSKTRWLSERNRRRRKKPEGRGKGGWTQNEGEEPGFAGKSVQRADSHEPII